MTLHPTTPLLLAALLTGCVGAEPEVQVSLSDRVATIPTVAWSTEDPTAAAVEYGLTLDYGSVTPETDAVTDHAVALLGLPSDATVHYRIVTPGEPPGPDHTLQTGLLPSGLPALGVEAGGEDTVSPAFTLFPWFAPDAPDASVYVVNRAGDVVWYGEADGQVLSVAFSADGLAVLALVSRVDESQSVIGRFPLDGGEPTFVSTPNAHHAFVELPNGAGYGYIASVTQNVEGRDIRGDRLMEVSLDGQGRELWNAFDWIPVEQNDGFGMEPPDWTHANGLDFDAVRGEYALSLYRQEQVYGIAKETGAVDWILGDGGDFSFPNDVGFGPQHGPLFTEDGILLFDNAADGDSARLVEYTLDEDKMEASLVWSQTPPDGAHTRIMGSVWPVAGGSLSAWGEYDEVVTMDDDGAALRVVKPAEVGVTGTVRTRGDIYP